MNNELKIREELKCARMKFSEIDDEQIVMRVGLKCIQEEVGEHGKFGFLGSPFHRKAWIRRSVVVGSA